MEVETVLIDTIINVTSCHPYYTQALCHEIFNVCLSKNKKDIVTMKNVDTARDKCIQSQSYAYTTIWDSLSGRQKSVVIALSSEPFLDY